ncbi:BRO1 domain [Lasallia pustulata]|uniref:pH-response regulator protein palC n=1 Tax=Lasallia pustulata TaxID=136370 RepID=A0A1W5D3L1_9LECA|nr:BRO1 domain [Lasallia pustulata]
MPYAFSLPTTSTISYVESFGSSTHPSLLSAATIQRAVLRNVLKKHKRLAIQVRDSDLSSVLTAINDYLPFLFALDAGLSGNPVNGEEIDIVLVKEVEPEWRASVATAIPGREAPRIKGKGLDYELCYVLTALAYVYVSLARVHLRTLYASQTPTADQRMSAIMTATKYLLQANSIHNYLSTRFSDAGFIPAAIDVSVSTQGALASLAMAEATLLAVLKDDSYSAAVAQERNKDDKEWMIKAPDIPKVRAKLFTRFCLAASEHGGRARAMLDSSSATQSKGVDEALVRYIGDLKRTSRAKACRFFAIDAEMDGKTGEALAWLLEGKKELGFASSSDEGSRLKGLAKLKKDWTERREDKKIEKGGVWGSDAGRLEEARVIEMLEKKWTKMNDTINTQIVPPSGPLLASMPSGRDIHSTMPYIAPSLDIDTLTRLRVPPERDEARLTSDGDDDSDEDHETDRDLPGAFPSTSTSNRAYY